MTSDSNGRDGAAQRPNASPELQDAIRSIDAIGENAWGKDDDDDEPRERDAEADPAADVSEEEQA